MDKGLQQPPKSDKNDIAIRFPGNVPVKPYSNTIWGYGKGGNCSPSIPVPPALLAASNYVLRNASNDGLLWIDKLGCHR